MLCCRVLSSNHLSPPSHQSFTHPILSSRPLVTPSHHTLSPHTNSLLRHSGGQGEVLRLPCHRYLIHPLTTSFQPTLSLHLTPSYHTPPFSHTSNTPSHHGPSHHTLSRHPGGQGEVLRLPCHRYLPHPLTTPSHHTQTHSCITQVDKEKSLGYPVTAIFTADDEGIHTYRHLSIHIHIQCSITIHIHASNPNAL